MLEGESSPLQNVVFRLDSVWEHLVRLPLWVFLLEGLLELAHVHQLLPEHHFVLLVGEQSKFHVHTEDPELFHHLYIFILCGLENVLVQVGS